MAKTGTHMPEVFGALCATAGEKVYEFNSQEIANTLWAMAKTGTHMPEVFLWSMAKTSPGSGSEGAGLQRPGPRQHAVGHGQGRLNARR